MLVKNCDNKEKPHQANVKDLHEAYQVSATTSVRTSGAVPEIRGKYRQSKNSRLN